MKNETMNPTTPTATPKTDLAFEQIQYVYCETTGDDNRFKDMADFARILETELAAKQRENVELKAQLAEAEKDKVRLDWLDGYKTGQFEDPYWKIYARGNQNLRTAIDAAMTKGGKK